jgi:hypothetical protein
METKYDALRKDMGLQRMSKVSKAIIKQLFNRRANESVGKRKGLGVIDRLVHRA